MSSPKRLRVAELWNEYAQLVLPKDAFSMQRQETRRAFYAGAQGLLGHILAALAPGAEPTAEDLAMVDDIQRELNDFADAVLKGRA